MSLSPIEEKIIEKIKTLTASTDKNSMREFDLIWKSYKDKVNINPITPIDNKLLWELFLNDLVGEYFKIKSFRILGTDVNREFWRYVTNHPLIKFLWAEFMFNLIYDKVQLN